MGIERKVDFIVYTKRGTILQPWGKENIHDGEFSEDQLTEYLKMYIDSDKWKLVTNNRKTHSDIYKFKAIPHPESEESKKRENIFYSLFCREDYIHVKVKKLDHSY